MCPSSDAAERRGGVNISGTVGAVGGDIVGGDKLTIGLNENKILDLLAEKGILQRAESASFYRNAMRRRCALT